MCGITGFWSRGPHLASVEATAVANKMAQALVHRGPDGAGTWLSESQDLALAHRRLSILDLSSAGHQPMVSGSGRYVISFNGEIYNHLELRRILGPRTWRGHSDTETLLAAFEAWGIEVTLTKLVGMFAIALWDQDNLELTLMRDRMGEKPLYYGWQGDTFLFGSELKALRCHPDWRGEVDSNALASFMRFSYVPHPHSIFKGVYKLLPGCFISIKTVVSPGNFPTPIPYWSAKVVATQDRNNSSDERLAIGELDILLRKSVSDQMVADVPLGAFLSGGIDSSVVVALMQAQSTRSIRTFSIGFSEAGYDEANYARAVANHLGTLHTELYVTPEDAIRVIPRMLEIYDEPFADSSQIPTYLVAGLAAQHVTVALTGDGGDELFGGYNRYFWGRRIWNVIGGIPISVREMLGRLITVLSPIQWGQLFALLQRGGSNPSFGANLYKIANIIDAKSANEFYLRLISQQNQIENIVLGAHELSRWSDGESSRINLQDFSESMMFQDLVGYLVDDILMKVDRAAMAVSLETRIPFLDHRLVEFAWRLPLSMKIRDGQGKWLLRQVLYQYVPREMFERPKQGFGVPLASWLRGPLRDWAEALLDRSRLERDGLLNAEIIRGKWEEHLSGRRDWHHWLWNVLIFQAWHEHWNAQFA